MKERPILFSTPMVRALLDGTKTQTRRLLKQPNRKDGAKLVPELLQFGGVGYACPYGATGDRLWVKETFLTRLQGQHVIYRAYIDPIEAAGISGMYGGWKPSIFMPRLLSRITLEITGVRVERLNDISNEDAKAEGIESIAPDDPFGRTWRNYYGGKPEGFKEPARSYQSLWESVNGKGSWEKNPFVWVISFRKL